VPVVKSSAATTCAAAFSAGFGLLSLVWAGIRLHHTEYLTAVVILGFAGFCFGLVGSLTIVNFGKVTPRPAFDAAGTTIRPDRRLEVLTVAWSSVTAIAMGLFAVFYPLGKLDIPLPHPLRYSLPFMSAAGAVMSALGLWRRLRRGEDSYVRLTPNGFEFPRSSQARRTTWAQVKNVTDRAPDQGVPIPGAIVVERTEEPALTMAAGSYTPGGQALRKLMRFYWQHPECRTELTDGRAVERLRKEKFEV
jgi:hypothetical protein